LQGKQARSYAISPLFTRKNIMARIYKRPDRSEFYIDLVDARGVRRRLAGYPSKPLTAELARRLEQLRDCRKAGMPPPDDARKWLESQPPADIAKWAKWDLVDAAAATASQPLRVHMEAWLADMEARRLTPHHIRVSRDHVTAMLDEMGAAYWNDLSNDKIRAALEARAGRRGVSAETFNQWLRSLRTLARWCMETGRAATDPTVGVKYRCQRTDRRHVRRPLSPEELRRLIAATNASNTVMRLLTGRERALLYLVAASTGWRWIELRRLRRMDFLLDASPPMIAPPASAQKAQREDKVPLRADVAELLRAYFADHPASPESPAFPMPGYAAGARMMRYDLARTGDDPETAAAKKARGEAPLEAIPYRDERGRVADFHSLRHALATMIGRAGIQVKLAQGIMRHADPAMTLGVYTHAEDSERAAALEALPTLIPGKGEGADNMIVGPTAVNAPEPGAAHGAVSVGKGRISSENADMNVMDGDFLIVDDKPCKTAISGESGSVGDAVANEAFTPDQCSIPPTSTPPRPA
jgi:integrase